MPKNCWLSFHPNLILAHQTSIFIIKYEVLGPYEEAIKKIAMCGNPAGTCWNGLQKNFGGPWRIKKRARSKNFWLDLVKALGPLSGHQSKFSNYAQSWLKSDAQFSLHRNFMGPKKPPLVPKRVFFRSGYLGVMYCPPWPSLVQIWQPLSVRSVSLRAG